MLVLRIAGSMIVPGVDRHGVPMTGRRGRGRHGDREDRHGNSQ